MCLESTDERDTAGHVRVEKRPRGHPGCHSATMKGGLIVLNYVIPYRDLRPKPSPLLSRTNGICPPTRPPARPRNKQKTFTRFACTHILLLSDLLQGKASFAKKRHYKRPACHTSNRKNTNQTRRACCTPPPSPVRKNVVVSKNGLQHNHTIRRTNREASGLIQCCIFLREQGSRQGAPQGSQPSLS